MYDGLSSVVGLAAPDGGRLQRYAYDPWGQLSVALSPNGTGNANTYRFTGEVQDPGTGLYYLRSRYYDPATGRFISADNYFSYPLLPLSLNKYAYVRNNPVRYIDRTGRDPWPESVEDPWASDFNWPSSPPWP
jgi:RHS repeat-associated protein